MDAAVVAVCTLVAAGLLVPLIYIKRLAARALGRELVYVAKLALAVFAVTLLLAATSPIMQLQYLFYVALVVMILTIAVLVLGAWHVIVQYFAGAFVTRELKLHTGDYVDLGDVRGHVVALGKTHAVLKSPERDDVYVPYTVFIQRPFRRVNVIEGREIRVRVLVPCWPSLALIKELILSESGKYGANNVSVDVEEIGTSGVMVVIRAVLRDLRKADEFRYAIVNRIYERAASICAATTR
ncbi:MAG: mechanosensitive ion channel [Thermoproteaceae archaeon]|jgi:hypothetical protein|nr:mechanosensitive ion channel [Thermoproteaceae archaeon]